MNSITIREVQPQDLDACYLIERTAYAGDEAASREKIAKRIARYPEGFVVAEQGGAVVGFINCGACFAVELSDEAFKELVGHDPAGPHVVIMSVAVDPAHQGQGIAGQLMRAFIARMRTLGKADIFLICQAALVPLYRHLGFAELGPSDSVHGGLAWVEMSLVRLLTEFGKLPYQN